MLNLTSLVSFLLTFLGKIFLKIIVLRAQLQCDDTMKSSTIHVNERLSKIVINQFM